MPPKISLALNYRTLILDIRREMERGVQKIEELLERQKVISSWAIGRKINTYLHTSELPRGAVGLFYQSLSKDLGINDRTLQQCEQFFRYFPKLELHKNLKWSHYRFLLTVPDSSTRQAWLERIKKEKIPAGELRLALLPPAQRDEIKRLSLKTPPRGRLYTYRLLRAEDVENFEIPWFVDLGFAGRKEAPDYKGVLHNKNLYTSEKTKDGYRLKVVDAKVDELFTFRAKVRRWVDADTPLAIIDQGFSMWIEQRLRLNGIDAPEKNTLAGERAIQWIKNELKDCDNLVVKTYKSDKWDRYLVDVFYIPKETDMRRVAAQGVWLNERMVTEGIAKIWKA